LIVLDQGRLAGILSLRDLLLHYIPVDQRRMKT